MVSRTPPRRGDRAYVRGVLLTLGISVLWASSPLFYRAIENTPAMEVVFYRSLFLSIGVAIFVGLKYRARSLSRIRAIGGPGLVAAFSLAAASLFFVLAVNYTTIAVIAFTYGATPFFAAIMGVFILREPVRKGTWVAMGVASMGIALMVLESFALGSMTGVLLAVGSMAGAAGFAVALRYGRDVDQVPAVLVSGLLGLIMTFPLVTDFTIDRGDLVLCAIQGLCISALCNSLFTLCARVVPAAELTLLSLLEIVLSPIGAWWLFTEIPSVVTLVGGGFLLVAILGHALGSIRSGSFDDG